MTAKKTNYAADYPTEFEQGRRARLSSVSREDGPYADVEDVKSKAREAWLAGFDDAEGEAARNETSGPQDDAKAGDQTSVVADANKAKAGK